ncbi:MAG: SDR family NAD(P)-dependent oxidoreductase [bacterium]|jgi:NAD(P)-dependent dehydrogenase (short-subunit alcohol dehydrogenase family)|nr:SDR family NAD(P)-dependent oxidoreductase [bacterium]
MPISVRDKVVIITGGAGELGSAMARRLVREGARVVIADVRDGSALVADLRQYGEARYVRADVGEEADTRRLAEETAAAYGRIDVLVNNAGIVTPKPFAEISLADWRARLRVNLDGAFLCTQAVLPAMREQRRGRIINIGSDTVWMGTPGLAHYVASKGGLLALTRALASELGPLGIKTVYVTPTLLDTPGTRQAFLQAHFDYVLNHTPIGRLETPDDVSGLIVFLCSDEADFINGSAINIGGGISMH